ncbi:MAG: zinc-ribbon domain-containing protein [Bryobacteraceae bacterium]
MPFCSQCGKQVDARDVYCAKCGARQPVSPTPPVVDPFASITPRTASVLCYIPGLGWVCSIIVLASERFRADRTVRFHAFQGLYLFVAYLIEEWVLKPMFWAVSHASHLPINGLIEAVLFGVSIFMIIKASRDEMFSLPIIGELAAKSVSER